MLFFYLSLIDTTEEKDKFEKLYLQYRNLMYHVANEILKDCFLSEDAVQTAFLKIIPNLNKIGEIGCHKTKSFLVIVTENVAKTIYTNRKKHETIAFEDVEYDIAHNQNEFDQILSDLSVNEIFQQIKALSRSDSEILMLRYIHELTNKEIAKLFEIKEVTVRKRIERAKGRLLEKLQRVER